MIGLRENIRTDHQGEAAMQQATFLIDEMNICVECAIALKKFIGGLEGVESIEALPGRIIISFDERGIDREFLNVRSLFRTIHRQGFNLASRQAC